MKLHCQWIVICVEMLDKEKIAHKEEIAHKGEIAHVDDIQDDNTVAVVRGGRKRTTGCLSHANAVHAGTP